MARNQPPPRRMVHSVMSQMRDEVDLKLKSKHDLSSKAYTQTKNDLRAQAFKHQIEIQPYM